ncbi:precorrin-2 dehydrogenase/sirohydrochlorin ferrochelatase family protein [Natronincola ferrireducens]|uniref:precorrin-2 dehydrogenase n=1 Tax=Natronincola ferrireducens TaxID=393762 RepID=A0A1G8WQZ1_9FIRM|nr:bifunctional precorrin-2 dehydrogenase/sirohydrochlorin ferrochelatase [Natronincola ferrireducens]SDJ80477.1 precorrin-2 dehydrogenase [Natronincola ferrireducens]
MALYYPMMVEIKGKPCTVVGGGEVAERKVITLLEYGAVVTVISPKLTPALEKLAKDNKIVHKNKPYTTGDLDGSILAYGVTDDADINKRCKQEANQRQIFINVGDSRHLSDFILPASINRGSLTITISTEGKSPMLSRKIKEELESIYGEIYGDLLDILGAIRGKALREIPSIQDRKRLFHHLIYDVDYRKEDPFKIKEKLWDTYEAFKEGL